ncbi:MAG: glycosyltransferase family 2 protein [Steroidobacteraceae bacterium]
MTPHLSAIVCTYNPVPNLMRRCLAAIAAAQQAAPFEVEVVLVDNNSDPPLASLAAVAEFLRTGTRRSLVLERRQGLTHARLAGLGATRAPTLVFIDDDNLVAADYFVAAAEALARFPEVAVWGPGVIEIEWAAGTSRWVRGYAACFQERHVGEPSFGAVAGWPDFYPTGTGLIARRAVLAEYAVQVEAGRLDASGRKGGQLTSGEDNQIVWTAVRRGLAAGTTPTLRLTHVIERRKATVRYVLRLVFATMASGRIAAQQSFPDRPDLWSPPDAAKAQVGIVALALKELLLLRVRSGPVKVVRQLGDVHGQFLAAGRPSPWLMRVAAKALGFAWGSP